MIKKLFSIGIIFLVLLPKGGFKIAGIPITWGYLYLGFLFLLITYSISKKEQFFIGNKHYLSFLLTLPFTFYLTIHILINKYIGSFGDLIAFYISFVFMPFLFYIYLGNYLKEIQQKTIDNLITNSLVIVSAYGIILFFIKFIYKFDVEIPYITINAGDVGQVADKYNVRGSVSKLISTYNNGNIFGICTLMFFPVFFATNKSKIKLSIVIFALILTLSRTVWLGLVFFYILYYRRKVYEFTKILIVFGVVLLIFGNLFLTKQFQYGSLSGFIFDNKFGGRIIQIRQSLSEITFFGNGSFKGIGEIVYLSILKQLGIFGLLLYCISFFTPIYLYFSTKNNNYSYIIGSLIYLFVCLSDGATLLIPTLCFFYFVNTMAFIDKQRS